MPQERACPFLWSSATIDAGGVHFKVLFGTCFRPHRFFRNFLGGFRVFTGVVVHLTPTASAASFGHRKMLAFFCDTHLARSFDIRIAFALRAMLCGSDIEINKFISTSFALIAFDVQCTSFFIKLLDRNSLHREFHGLKFLENLLEVGYSNFTQRTDRPVFFPPPAVLEGPPSSNEETLPVRTYLLASALCSCG